MSAFELQNLNVYYGNYHANKDINMEIERNKITALIGSSGCGKSTLLRSLNRMNDLVPNCRVLGTVLLEGEDIYRSMDINLLRKRVGMVFQKPSPFAMSIYDNIAYGLKTHGIKNIVEYVEPSRAQREQLLKTKAGQKKIAEGKPLLVKKVTTKKEQIMEIVEKSLKAAALWEDVKDRLNKNALGLSGGQQQRLCIARSLAISPEVLLMDEATSALDPRSTAKIEELIVRLKEKYTIIMVTHNMRQTMRIADNTAFFVQGELIEYGNTKQIFDNAKDERTAEFLSSEFA